MISITFTSRFHPTSYTFRVDLAPDRYAVPLSKSQVRRAEKALCGMSDCDCALWDSHNDDYKFQCGGNGMLIVRKNMQW